MTAPCLLITIDTEGDNLWARPREIRTVNSRYLPRFQALCEKYGFVPTWLANYEMACCPVFQEFAHDVLDRGVAELGMHLHAWNSPPIVPLTDDDYRYQPFLIEYSADVVRSKVEYLTKLLQDTFGRAVTSHRAGRWAMDDTYAEVLLDLGYEVDCSVTPTISWRQTAGAPGGMGGTDYTDAPFWPYVMASGTGEAGGQRDLVELPMTTRRAYPRLSRWVPQRVGRRWPFRSVTQARVWFRPKGDNLQDMISLIDTALTEGWPYLQFMLHSSEFMPGGSPTFRTAEDIERLYEAVEAIFTRMQGRFAGRALTPYARDWRAARTSNCDR